MNNNDCRQAVVENKQLSATVNAFLLNKSVFLKQKRRPRTSRLFGA